MKVLLRSALLAGAMFLPLSAWAAGPEGDEDQDKSRDEIVVTGLAPTPRETPQSITIFDRTRIDDFALTNVNDQIAQLPGIHVERVETDRTYFNSRGFDVSNFQVDGIGMPLFRGIEFGDLDSATVSLRFTY
ncbi:TonB-dependent receptor plug domain-containing protein [Sphingomonas kyeonggiensis]|uniref:Outer membrane receptor for ferric coprogen and ferric-rhodotorulic acid n=1 Tax=Sphingomonas kyeonggiensis TaxID=1268553 RepID=A0A7W6JND5_9SPHN|nr:TonB-dependent receptor plug domain-containing protein [Sphingomonas kyeonggiensis]MBB4096478.1 outer membrane receptor for ferric coprogen and ferric-rhodotorulic acid [Sphingomonas kyeonggiensis]